MISTLPSLLLTERIATMISRLRYYLLTLALAAPLSGFASSATSLSQFNCTSSTILTYISTCTSAWNSMGSGTSISSSSSSYNYNNNTSLAICYNRNLCECISALYPAYNMSLVQTCSMAVATAYFDGAQSKNVATASASSSNLTPLEQLQRAMMTALFGSSS